MVPSHGLGSRMALDTPEPYSPSPDGSKDLHA
jgi:hypothetical protein